jgi:ABC-type microcin C transport system duplicated ATPase subunit YejF
MSVGDIVAEGLSVHQGALSREEREARVIKALRDVGMDPATRFRYPHEFSGGQRQRISIARAVVLEPNFVVLDEPTSALDMLFQAQMVDLLRELQRKRDLTYMFISHDLRVVASLASHLIVMRRGKVVGGWCRPRNCSRIRRPITPARCLPPRFGWKPSCLARSFMAKPIHLLRKALQARGVQR